MIDKIILNDKEFIPTEVLLPSLIHYLEKTGGSHYSVTMVAHLFNTGSKVLFFTAYPMARENFLEQVGMDENKIAYVSTEDELKLNQDKQCIILDSGNQELLNFTLDNLADINERVILIKNIEKFENEIILKVIAFDKVILSGHIDECDLKSEISQKAYNSVILFNVLDSISIGEIPSLDKYTAYFWTKDLQGITKIEK